LTSGRIVWLWLKPEERLDFFRFPDWTKPWITFALDSWAQCYKTFYGRNLRIFVIS
jgi:hypothetical protein